VFRVGPRLHFVTTLKENGSAAHLQTEHLRNQLPEAEYVSIFETIWRDRAEAAGWHVELRYEGTRATLRFTKKAEAA
jgi:hypothetical protein